MDGDGRLKLGRNICANSHVTARIDPMKAPQAILTHAAVFAVGVTMAVVFQGSKADSSDDSAGSQRGRSSAARSSQGVADGSDSKLASLRERREAAGKGGKSSGPITERLEGVIRLGDPLERQSALLELVAGLSPDQFAAVADQYREMEHFGNSRGEYDIILRGWAKADPLGALDYTSNHPNSRDNSSIVLSAWAGNDAFAAEQWARDKHEGDGVNPWMASVIRGVAVHDLAQATRLTEGMPSSRERGEAIDAITRALFVQGTDAALDYPATILDPQLRAGFIDNITRRLASKDPVKAADWLASNPDADIQNRTARAVGDALARQDPTVAAGWLKKLSPAAQAEAARGIVPRMSSGDIAGTAQWVTTLSGIPNYDRVVEEFVWSCDQRAPEQSAAWIQGVANVEQRDRLYHRMLGEWSQRDPNAVKNWIANNEVPESIIRRFNR